MSKLNIASICAVIVAVLSGGTSASLAALGGDKYGPLIAGVLAGVSLIASKVLSTIDSEQTKAAVSAAVITGTPEPPLPTADAVKP